MAAPAAEGNDASTGDTFPDLGWDSPSDDDATGVSGSSLMSVMGKASLSTVSPPDGQERLESPDTHGRRASCWAAGRRLSTSR